MPLSSDLIALVAFIAIVLIGTPKPHSEQGRPHSEQGRPHSEQGRTTGPR